MSEVANDESRNHIVLSTPIFYLLLSGVFTGGAGLYGTVAPRMEQAAIQQCFDNAAEAARIAGTALDVARQHGQEFLDLRNLIYQRTSDRYTAQAAQKDWAQQERRDAQQDREISHLKRDLDRDGK